MLDERERRLLRDLVAWEGGETETERSVRDALPPDLSARTSTSRRGRGDLRPMRPRLAAGDARPIRPSSKPISFTSCGPELFAVQLRAAVRVLPAAVEARAQGQAEQVAATRRGALSAIPRATTSCCGWPRRRATRQPTSRWSNSRSASSPRSGRLYLRLARVQLQARQAEQAQRTLLSYPLLRGDKANPPSSRVRRRTGALCCCGREASSRARCSVGRGLRHRFRRGDVEPAAAGAARAQLVRGG